MFQRTPYLIIQQLCLLTIFVISFNCREAVAQAKISTEGELRSIRDAGFDYDDLTDSSGNTEIDNRVKEVIDFVNNDGFIRSFSLTMKFGFLDDTRIKEPSYEGNGFHVLSRNRDKMPTGTIYLTKQAVTRAFAANKDLIYTLVLHQAAQRAVGQPVFTAYPSQPRGDERQTGGHHTAVCRTRRKPHRVR